MLPLLVVLFWLGSATLLALVLGGVCRCGADAQAGYAEERGRPQRR